MEADADTVVVSFADGYTSKDGLLYERPLPDPRGFPFARTAREVRLYNPFVATPAWKVRDRAPPRPRSVGSLAFHEKMSAAHEEIRNWFVVFCFVYAVLINVTVPSVTATRQKNVT